MRPKERLLRNDVPKGAIRGALESWSDRLSSWGEFFTAVVVLGLVIEYFPEVARFLPTRAFTATRPYTELLRELGGFLVIVGVVGELWIGFRSSKVETDLREETGKDIAETQERAARAEERAALAEQATAEANLARAKIEQRMRPRILGEMEIRVLIDLLTPYNKTRLEIIVFDVHVAEPLVFSDQLASLFVSAGFQSVRHWEAQAGTHRIAGPSVIIAVAKGHEDEFKELANKLAHALRAIDIECGVGLGVFGCEGPNERGQTRPYEFGPPQYHLRFEKPKQFMGIRAVYALRIEVGAKQLTPIPSAPTPRA